MGDRERAVVATYVVTAMREQKPAHLNPVIEQLAATPWDQDVLQIVKAVQRELERQKFAAKPKR